MLGYDTVFFTGDDDWQMVMTALNEGRVILTRDTEILRRGVVASGRVKALLLESDNPEHQIQQVVKDYSLDTKSGHFSRCLECNQPLETREKENVRGRVPPYVFQTQTEFMECPSCHRIYWKGTHWQDMTNKMRGLHQ
jgi:uncharacterized protein with PIN domain